jgi:YVTN family beta-propeller protein
MTLRLLAFAAALLALSTAALAQHRLLVLNKAEHTMSVLDPRTLKSLGKVDVGRGPHEVAVSADGRTAYVANYGDQAPNNSLSIVDLATMKETKRVDLGALARPHGMVENGGKIYFTSEVSRAIARYDPVADKVDWIAGTGQTATHMIAVQRDGKRYWTTNIGSDTVTAIQVGPPTGGIWQVKVGKQPEAIDLSPDESELWIGQNGDGHITVIDTASRTVKETFKVGELPIRLKFTPDGKRVVVTDPKGAGVIVLDAATRKEVKRIPMDGVPLGIQMAPDGKRAFIARAQAGTVEALDLEKLEIVGSGPTGKGPDGLAYAVAR